jgi:hypothetical protein
MEEGCKHVIEIYMYQSYGSMEPLEDILKTHPYYPYLTRDSIVLSISIIDRVGANGSEN